MDVLGYRVPHFADPAFLNYIKGFILRRLGLRKKGSDGKSARLDGKNSMNPVDYWYETNPALRLFIDSFWENNQGQICDDGLLKDMSLLMGQEAVYDKLLCLNVLSAILKITG